MEEAIKVMKAGKAGGPSEVVGEMLKAAGKKGIKRLTELCNQVVRKGAIPREWELSTLIHKVLEGVLEKRLRQKVKIDDMQFGFVPGKGTVDAIFMVRQLQEKFLEKRKDLFFAFVDLEKAFDRLLYQERLSDGH